MCMDACGCVPVWKYEAVRCAEYRRGIIERAHQLGFEFRDVTSSMHDPENGVGRLWEEWVASQKNRMDGYFLRNRERKRMGGQK
jgi:hypothetical protein